MSEIEKSKRFGVPLPETCHLIKWERPTKFYWYETEQGEFELYQTPTCDFKQWLVDNIKHLDILYKIEYSQDKQFKKERKFYSNSRLTQGKISAFTEVCVFLGIGDEIGHFYETSAFTSNLRIPAPQIDEILCVLPPTILFDGEILFFDFQTVDMDHQYIQYSKENHTQSDFYAEVVDNHYADAYAKLYQQIKLYNSEILYG